MIALAMGDRDDLSDHRNHGIDGDIVRNNVSSFTTHLQNQLHLLVIVHNTYLSHFGL